MNFTEAIAHLRKDSVMNGLIEQIQMPDFSPSGRMYFDLLKSIVSQQLSGKAAATIFGRFLDLFPERNPHPELVLQLAPERLRQSGLSNQKANYIQNVADFALRTDLENYPWESLSDEAIIEYLTQIKGVGKWTVEMLLMFSLGRPDVMPVDDLGIQQAIRQLYSVEESGKLFKVRMLEIAAPWRPYRTFASRYLWRFKDATP